MEQQIPDAPWYGMPEPKDIYCPVCDAENPEKFYVTSDTNMLIGCSRCIKPVDPYDYLEEAGGPD